MAYFNDYKHYIFELNINTNCEVIVLRMIAKGEVSIKHVREDQRPSLDNRCQNVRGDKGWHVTQSSNEDFPYLVDLYPIFSQTLINEKYLQ